MDPLRPPLEARMTTMAERLEAARAHQMTECEKAAQVRSFAYGNAHIGNDDITMTDIDAAIEAIEGAK